jgi:hypothetical protein
LEERASEKTAFKVTLIRSHQINVTTLSLDCTFPTFFRGPGAFGVPAIPDWEICRLTNPRSGGST